MSRYASNGGGPVNASREFKQMVKAFHDAGIEVRARNINNLKLRKKYPKIKVLELAYVALINHRSFWMLFTITQMRLMMNIPILLHFVA